MSSPSNTPTAFPLAWPLGWPRSKEHRRSPFKQPSLTATAKEVYRQIGMLMVPDWNVVISTNVELRRDGLPYSHQRKPADPGAAVYFRLPKAGDQHEPRVLACDRWASPEENLRAIALHLEAMRGMERWGVGSLDRAFAGYQALPPPPEVPHWCITLGVAPTASEAEVRAAYAERVKRAHPDHGGSADGADLRRVREAFAAARAALGIEAAKTKAHSA